MSTPQETPIDLPPIAKVGETGHVDNHNKLRAAIDAVNKAAPTKAELAATDTKADTAQTTAGAAKTTADTAKTTADAAKSAATKATADVAGKLFSGSNPKPTDEHDADNLYREDTPAMRAYTPKGVGWDAKGASFGEYALEGSICHLRLKIVLGEGFTFPKGAPLQISLPPDVVPLPGDLGLPNGHSDVILFDHSASLTYFGVAFIDSTDAHLTVHALAPQVKGIDTQLCTDEFPWTWDQGDWIGIPMITFVHKPSGTREASK